MVNTVIKNYLVYFQGIDSLKAAYVEFVLVRQNTLFMVGIDSTN